MPTPNESDQPEEVGPQAPTTFLLWGLNQQQILQSFEDWNKHFLEMTYPGFGNPRSKYFVEDEEERYKKRMERWVLETSHVSSESPD